MTVDRDSLDSNYEWDAFISHATKDKSSFVEPFAKKLRDTGLKVWYDRFELKWGSKLVESINNGLKNSKYGIVVLSEAFFERPWPKAELNALYNMMLESERDALLPLRHGISHKELIEKAPLLSNIVSRSSDDGINALALEFYEIVKGQQVGYDKYGEVTKMADWPILQIVNRGVEPPSSADVNSAKYHPNLRNDGDVAVSNVRIYYKAMNRVVTLGDIVRQEREIRSNVIVYEGSILPAGSARVDPMDLPRTKDEASTVFWIEYDFGANESTEIVFDLRFKNFNCVKVIP